MNRSMITLIIKDLKELINNRQALIAMFVVPLTMVIFMPIIIFVSANTGYSNFNGMEELIKKVFPNGMPYPTEVQNIIYLSIHYMFPGIFLLIPLMSSSILAAISFVSEKEHKTMESLLYTPLNIKQIFWSKIWGVFIPAYSVTLISFIIFTIVINLGGYYYFGKIIFPDLKWILLIAWLSPTLNFFSLTFLVLFSSKAENYHQATQVSIFIIAPIIFLIISQMSGIFLLSSFIIFITGFILILLNIIMLQITIKKFDPESFVK